MQIVIKRIDGRCKKKRAAVKYGQAVGTRQKFYGFIWCRKTREGTGANRRP